MYVNKKNLIISECLSCGKREKLVKQSLQQHGPYQLMENPTNQRDVQNCLPSHVFPVVFLMLTLRLRAGALL